jgi:prepilin-type N-terminal cleavage/methylation domain-containing protein
MTKGIYMKTSSRKGFTLIELLVVITIIGILASLAIPTIGKALAKANQTRDLNNIKQTGTTLFIAANDDNGVFKAKSSNGGGMLGTSTEVFQELLNDGVLSSASVLAGTNVTPASDSTNLDSSNVAWEYVRGLTTSSNPNIPLLVSFGTGAELSDMTSGTDFSLSAGAGDAMWGDEGVLVYYVGGNASFLAATGSGKNVKFNTAEINAVPSAAELLQR